MKSCPPADPRLTCRGPAADPQTNPPGPPHPFRDARIDPSRLPSIDGIRNTESCRSKKPNL